MADDKLVRVVVRDALGRAIRCLDLAIVPNRVMQGSRWIPGVEPAVGEIRDAEAAAICYEVNESFDRDPDGFPLDGEGEGLNADDEVDTRWKSTAVAAGTPKPDLSTMADDPPAAPAP